MEVRNLNYSLLKLASDLALRPVKMAHLTREEVLSSGTVAPEYKKVSEQLYMQSFPTCVVQAKQGSGFFIPMIYFGFS